MDRDDVVRTDFPESESGYDRATVVAHLEAVAAQIAALEARTRALEVQLEAVRTADASDPGNSSRQVPDASDAAPTDRSGGRAGDPVSARLVATELVLDGVERDQVIDRIEAEYDLTDVPGLVDEVIARTS